MAKARPAIDRSIVEGYSIYRGLSNAIEKNRALLEKDQGSREIYLSMNYMEKKHSEVSRISGST